MYEGGTSMRKTIGAALVAAMTVLAGGAQAETLVFATTNPEQHPLNQGFLIPWAQKINETAAGAVEIELRHGPVIANHTNFYDRLTDDVIQVAWGMTIFNPGKWPRSLVATLPFMVENSEQGSMALCRMHEKGAFDAEMGDIVPLLFVEFPQASLHLNGHKATAMEDMAGLKVITSVPAIAGVIGAFGGAPLSFGVTELYEAIQRGSADGTIINFTAFPAFRLNEVTTDHYVIPLGGAMGMVFMAKSKWDSLSDGARAAILAQSGCEGSLAFGKFIDALESKSKAMVEGVEGHTVTYATPEQLQALVEKLGPGIEAGFAGHVPDGAKLVEMFKQELAAAKAK